MCNGLQKAIKKKKSDLNQNNPIFFDFLKKIMIFINPESVQLTS